MARVLGSYFFFLCVITLWYFRYIDWALCLLASGIITLILVHRVVTRVRKQEALDASRGDKGVD